MAVFDGPEDSSSPDPVAVFDGPEESSPSGLGVAVFDDVAFVAMRGDFLGGKGPPVGNRLRFTMLRRLEAK